jgi:hypothetical protein
VPDITITNAVLVLRPRYCRVRWCNIKTHFLLLKTKCAYIKNISQKLQ